MKKRILHIESSKLLPAGRHGKAQSSKFIFAGIFIVLMIAASFLLKDKFFPVLAFFSQPFSDLKRFLGNAKISFSEKLVLNEENKRLREEIIMLKSRVKTAGMLEKELSGLEKDLGRIKFYEENPILGKVIFRYFDGLIIDVGEESGAKQGMKVIAYGNILIGRISEVYQNYSKIKLISENDHEENVFLGISGISAIARGQGNYEFLIELPSSIETALGESVYTLSPRPYLIGILEKIEKSESESLQKLHFIYPFNFSELRSVFLVK